MTPTLAEHRTPTGAVGGCAGPRDFSVPHGLVTWTARRPRDSGGAGRSTACGPRSRTGTGGASRDVSSVPGPRPSAHQQGAAGVTAWTHAEDSQRCGLSTITRPSRALPSIQPPASLTQHGRDEGESKGLGLGERFGIVLAAGLVLKRDRARELGTRSEGTAAPLVSESKSPGGTSDVIPASLVPHGDLRPFASARQRALVAARAPATRRAQSTRNGVVPA
ncbi:unnamed protein product [Lampetra fluviatilis]